MMLLSTNWLVAVVVAAVGSVLVAAAADVPVEITAVAVLQAVAAAAYRVQVEIMVAGVPRAAAAADHPVEIMAAGIRFRVRNPIRNHILRVRSLIRNRILRVRNLIHNRIPRVRNPIRNRILRVRNLIRIRVRILQIMDSPVDIPGDRPIADTGAGMIRAAGTEAGTPGSGCRARTTIPGTAILKTKQ
jgi:hypothetical protein